MKHHVAQPHSPAQALSGVSHRVKGEEVVLRYAKLVAHVLEAGAQDTRFRVPAKGQQELFYVQYLSLEK